MVSGTGTFVFDVLFHDCIVCISFSLLLIYCFSESTTTVSRSQTSDLDSLGEVEYKGVIKLVAGYTPPLSCREHMLQVSKSHRNNIPTLLPSPSIMSYYHFKDLPSLLPDVSDISGIVNDCVLVAESRCQHLPSSVPKLTPDEALSIATYSYDLGFADRYLFTKK